MFANEGKIRPWDETKYIDFLQIKIKTLQSKDQSKIEELNDKLEHDQDLNKDNINEVMGNIKSNFEGAAGNTFGRFGAKIVSNTTNKQIIKTKQWFNGDCR